MTVAFSIQKKKQPDPYRSSLLFFICCLLLGLWGSLGSFLTGFAMSFPGKHFMASTIVFSVFWTCLLFPWSGFRKKRLYSFLPLLSIGTFLALLLFFWEPLSTGFVVTANHIIEAYQAKQDVDLLPLPLPALSEDVLASYQQAFFLWLICLWAFLLAWLLIRKQWFFGAFFISALLPAFPLAFTIIPRPLPTAGLLLFWCLLLFQSQAPSPRLRALLQLVPAALLLVLLFVMIPRDTYQRNPSVEALRSAIWKLDFSLNLFEGPSVDSDIPSGGGTALSADLRSAGELKQSGELALQIFSTMPQTDYLKGFVGSVYEDGQWTELPQSTFTSLRTKLMGYLPQQFPALFTTLFPLREDGSPYQLIVHQTDSSDRTIYAPYGLVSDVDVLNSSGILMIQDSHFRAKTSTPAAYTYFVQPVSYSTYAERLGGTPMEDGSSQDLMLYYPHEIAKRDRLSLTDLQLTGALPSGALAFSVAAETYVNFIYEAYTQLPAKLERTLATYCLQRDLSADDYETVWEAAEAVAKLVQEENVYSTIPGKVPADEDPISWFLLENHKGYCMHFASSVTAILRAMDIPARYASGYTVSYDDFSVTPGGSSLPYEANLTYKRAHAWVEVYASGYGWVPIEVTPGTENGIPPVEEETPPSEPETLPEETETTAPQPSEEETAPPSSEAPDEDPSEDSAGSPLTVLKALGILAVVFLFSGLLLFINRIVHQKLQLRRFSQKDRNRAALEYYRYCLTLLCGLEKDPENIPDPLKELALRARFSQHTLTRKEVSQLRTYAAELQKEAESTFSPEKLFFWRYVLGRL